MKKHMIFNFAFTYSFLSSLFFFKYYETML